jgi:hypothetical protein
MGWIYKTTDGGQLEKYGFAKFRSHRFIVVDPKNSDVVWVAVLGALWGDSNERGIYKTTDGGIT